jgi:hypothetical protein
MKRLDPSVVELKLYPQGVEIVDPSRLIEDAPAGYHRIDLGEMDITLNGQTTKKNTTAYLSDEGEVLLKVNEVGKVFKVGDNIAGKIVQKVRPGTNGKIAVIGRQMDGHLNDVVSTLQGQGKQVEAFSESFQYNKTFNIDGQNYTWQQIKDDFANPINPITGQRKYTSMNQQGWIADSDVPNTLMYKANQQWAQKLIDDGYEIIDIGYPAGQNLDPSLFYNMELSIIFP